MPMSVKIDKKKDLEIILQKLRTFPNPKPWLEQYSTPPSVASSLLWQVKMEKNIDDVVYDLGCGTGTLTIGAKLLGARKAVGIDIDSEALRVAEKNAKKLDVKVNFVQGDIKNIKGSADIVVQNPPFGCQKRGSDRPFIEKALEIAPVVYSLHMKETEHFVEKYVKELGGSVEYKILFKFPLPPTMPWHKKKVKEIDVLLFKFIRN